jgi:DNA-binding MltR family transcriptional regulator
MRWSVTHPAETAAIEELYYHGSDRAVGIVIASIVEVHLTTLIKGSLIKDSVSINGEAVDSLMFRSSGPLGSFSAKIRLAYLLGLISEECFRDLENMKNIRNQFAHHLEIGSFDVPTIADKCKNFKLVERYVINDKEGVFGDPAALFGLIVDKAAERLSRPKERYGLTGEVLALGLQQATPDATAWTPAF